MKDIRAEAEEYGLTRHTHGTTGRFFWTVKCCTCGEDSTYNFKPNLPVEVMTKKLKAEGWQLKRGHPPICHTCLHPRNDKVNTMKNPTTHPAAGPAPKIAAAIVRLLDERFDAEAGRYDDGWSDDKVAEEADCSVGAVVAMRVGAFGELAPEVDPAILILQAKADSLYREKTEWAAEFDRQLEEIRDQLRALNPPKGKAVR